MNKEMIRANKNKICIILAILIIVAYLFLDGWGMYVNSYRLLKSAETRQDTTTSDTFDSYVEQFVQEDQNAYVIRDMKEQYFARIMYLSVALFPIIYIALRYHISFKKKGSSELAKWMPYLRVIFGVFAFYYIMTINTAFTHEAFTKDYWCVCNSRSFYNRLAFFDKRC